MWKAQNRFKQELRALIADRIGDVFDFKLLLMEREIAEGWRCFHARAIWFQENLPPPLVNDLGRKYACEWLLSMLYKDYGQTYSSYDGSFLNEFFASEEIRRGYRNFLCVGELELLGAPSADMALDKTANEITKNFVEVRHRHFLHETHANATAWLVEAGNSASLTPPFSRLYYGKQTPVRDMNLPITRDAGYWRLLYSDGFATGSVFEDFATPEWPLSLMAELATDFQYTKDLSTRTRLVFVEASPGKPAWAIVFRKPGTAFFYPPSLLLLSPEPGKKWSDANVLFEDLLEAGVPQLHSARGIELFLRYILPRFRRLKQFYQPFVDAALENC